MSVSCHLDLSLWLNVQLLCFLEAEATQQFQSALLDCILH